MVIQVKMNKITWKIFTDKIIYQKSRSNSFNNLKIENIMSRS